MDDIITVKKSEISQFVVEGGKLVLKKTAENELVKLLNLKVMIDEAVEEVKKNIAESGKKIFPDFKGVFGKRVKAVYRLYGDRWTTTNPEFIKKISFTRTDTHKIEEFVSERGELPANTSEVPREGKLVIQFIDEEQWPLTT